MDYGTRELIEFLNNSKGIQKDIEYKTKINNIVGFWNLMDMVNGQSYLDEIIKDQEIEKYLKYRQPQENYNVFGHPISEEISFAQNCWAVIVAIYKAILEDKVKDEFKNQARPDFKNFIELVEFYNNVINK
ncbi:MAG: hypothetical protein IJW82_04380 [Clostridia bacterium]|nr:hypothetical protein [Clostridia bacterium]